MREQLFLRTTDQFTKNHIDLRLVEKVAYVDVTAHAVGLTNRTTLGYQKLLIASGSRVTPWGREKDEKAIYRLQTIDDADRLLTALPTITHPLVIGSSFISLEFLDIFLSNHITPILLVRGSEFFGNMLDISGSELLREHFEHHGIKGYFKDEVSAIQEKEALFEVVTKGATRIPCDALAVGVGVTRNLEFLLGSGIALGERGVRVNEFLETNIGGIFAAGDITEFYDVILKKYRVVGNWTNAFLQGKQAALNMLGRREPFQNVSAYSITNLGFQITALGEYGETHDTIVRIDPMQKHYERFFLRDGVLVGAALINRFQDKPYLAELIAHRVNVEQYRSRLRDFQFDIHTIEVLS